MCLEIATVAVREARLPLNGQKDSQMIKRSFLLCCSTLFFAFALSADTFSFGFSSSSSFSSDCTKPGDCAAGATITTGNGTLVVQLESFVLNPVSSGQALSGINITLGKAPTSDSLTDSSGQLINISSTGVVSDVIGSPDHWDSSFTSTTICLATIGPSTACGEGAKPRDMIIGSSPSYPNANNGFGNFNPYIQGIGTFDLSVGGINMDTTVTSVSFLFGTSAVSSGVITTTCTAGNTGCGPTPLGGPSNPPTVPEPMSLVLLGSISLGLVSVFRKKLRGTV